MKYWNKTKEVRLRCWTKVSLPYDPRTPTGNYDGWHSWTKFINEKRKLQLHPSKYRFFMIITKKEIWFESSYDALEFKLKNSVR